MRDLVLEYAQAHHTIKTLRKRQKELQALLLEYMNEHNIDECAWEGGKLVRKVQKKTEGLKKEHIQKELQHVLGDAHAEQALANMNSRRATDLKETLSLQKTARAADDDVDR